MKLNAFAATTISPFFRSLLLEISGFCERRLTGVEVNSPNRPQAASRLSHRVSIVEGCTVPVECPLFAVQI